jgi:hypothetical protein
LTAESTKIAKRLGKLIFEIFALENPGCLFSANGAASHRPG